MLRMTPPTKATFWLSVLAIAAGIVLHLDFVDVAGVTNPDEYAFWLSTGGGILLVVGVLFKRI